MAFNNVGEHFVSKGKSVRILLWWADNPSGWGDDMGAQWIMADPKLQLGGKPRHALIVKDHTKASHVASNGTQRWRYEVTVVNDGPSVRFSLQGGGNV
jgi:hypothetical protein